MLELTLRGFNGGTDRTDHLILWIATGLSLDEAKTSLTDAGLLGSGQLISSIASLPEGFPETDANFTFPQQLDELRAEAERRCTPRRRQPMRVADGRNVVRVH